MSQRKLPPRSILRRRENLSSDVEALLDGAAVISIAYAAAIHFRGGFAVVDLLLLLMLLGSMTVAYDMLGVYRKHGGLAQKTFRLARAWGISFAIVLLVTFFAGLLVYFPRGYIGAVFVAGFLVQLLINIAVEYTQRKLFGVRRNEKALIIGTGWLADFLRDRINSNPWIHETVIGAVRMPGGEETKDPEQDDVGTPLVGNADDIEYLLDENGIRTVYIVTSLDSSPALEALYFKLLDRSININWIPNIFALNLINHSVKELAGIPVITLSETPLRGRQLLLKNIEDKLLASLGLLLASPLMLITAAAVKLESPGPVFFLQNRTGWDGRVFKIWKFRSMRVHEPDEGAIKQATRGDPRVTRVGGFIRRTSIDELPQLFNVLRGEMSLVGPRPHAIQHNDLYSQKINAYLARHRIKPGITGLAQVRGFRGETEDLRLMAERVKHDIEYINNWSLMLDLSIIFRTVFTLLSSRAY